MTADFQDWTPCEVHGHHYEDERCVDCGEEQEL